MNEPFRDGDADEPVAPRALETVRAASRTLARVADEAALVQAICDVAVDHGGYRMAWVGYCDGDTVRPAAHAGHEAGYLTAARVRYDDSPAGRGPVGTAIRSGRPALARWLGVNPAFAPWREAAIARGYAACIALPIRWQETTYGALTIYAGQPEAFEPDEAELLHELADKLAHGLHTLRLRAADERHRRTLHEEGEAQAALRRILALALQPLPLEEKLDSILELLFAVSWLRIEHKGAVFLADPQRGTLRLCAKRHLNDVLHTLCAEVPYGHCLCGRAAASGETLFRAHVDDDHDTAFPSMSDHGHYCQPLLSDGRLLGVLNLYVAAGHQASAQEREFVRAVGDTFAGIIEREQTEEACRQAERDLAAREQAFANIVINSLPGVFFLLDADGRFMRWNDNLPRQLGYDDERLANLGLLDLIAEEDALRVQRVFETDRAVGYSLEVSFRTASGDRVPYLVNVTHVTDARQHALSLVGVGFDIRERKALERRLEHHATRDALTGALNRRRFGELLREAVDEARVRGQPLTLLMFDLDHFKAINDRFGHAAGDEVLRAVVARCRDALREDDLLGRWGGEEFVVLLPGLDAAGSRAIAERIRLALRAAPVGVIPRITASLGVAALGASDDAETLLRRADDALYTAKHAGRDRVCSAPEVGGDRRPVEGY